MRLLAFVVLVMFASTASAEFGPFVPRPPPAQREADVRTQLAEGALFVEWCAWMHLGDARPAHLTITVPVGARTADAMRFEPSTYGASAEDERLFRGCLMPLVGLHGPYVGRTAVSRTYSLHRRAAPARVQRDVEAAIATRRAPIEACLAGHAPTALRLDVLAGEVRVDSVRIPGEDARVDGVLQCVSMAVADLGIARHPHREWVEIPLPLR